MSNIQVKIFEEGSEAKDLLLHAMEVRKSLGSGTIGFGTSEKEKAQRQHAYLVVLNSLPFTQEVARVTRAKMDLKYGDTVLDVGSSYCPDMDEIQSRISLDGELICIDVSAEALEQASQHYLEIGVPEQMKFTAIHQDASKITLQHNSVASSREIRTLQQADNPEIIVSEMVRVTEQGGSIVLVDPDWTSQAIEGSSIDKSLVRLISVFSDTGKPYGVMNPNVAQTTSSFLRASGAKGVEEEVLELRTSDFNRVDLALGITRKLPALVERECLTKQCAEFVENTLREEFESGRAFMKFPYHIVTGYAP